MALRILDYGAAYKAGPPIISEESSTMGTIMHALAWYGSEISILFMSYKNIQSVYPFLNATYK